MTCFEANYNKLIEWDGMPLSGVTFAAIFKITGEEQIKAKLKQLEQLKLIELYPQEKDKNIRLIGILVGRVTCEAALKAWEQE